MKSKFSLVRVEGLFLYFFFDYSVGKFVVVILVNKQKYYFFLDEFLKFSGNVIGSRVFLFLSSRFGVLLSRKFGCADLHINLFNEFFRRFVISVFVRERLYIDFDSVVLVRSLNYWDSCDSVEGLNVFYKFYCAFFKNLCTMLFLRFSFFFFYFLFLFFFSRFIWWFIIIIFVFKYIGLVIFLLFYGYLLSCLNVEDLSGFIKFFLDKSGVKKELILWNKYWLFNLLNSCFFWRDLVNFRVRERNLFYIFRYFLLGLKKMCGILSNTYLYKVVKLLSDFLVSKGNYSSWFWSILVLSGRFYNLLNREFGLGGWRGLLKDFCHYYYLEENKVFSFWTFPQFRRFRMNFYLLWFRQLGVQCASRVFFSFGLERFITFRRVGRSLSRAWFSCLLSIFFFFLTLFYLFFFDYQINKKWIVFLIVFFRLFLFNLQRFFYFLIFLGSLGFSYRELFFKFWLLVLGDLVVSKMKYELIYRLLMFFFFGLSSLEYKRVRRLHRHLRFFEFYNIFVSNLKFMILSVWNWLLVVYLLVLINFGLLSSGTLNLRFLISGRALEVESYFVNALEVWEGQKWSDMFRGGFYSIFVSFLGKSIRSLVGLDFSTSLNKLFWSRFVGNFGRVFSRDNLRLGLSCRRKLSNWKSQFIYFHLGNKRLGKVFMGGRSRSNFLWNYENLVLESRKFRKLWSGLWFRVVKSYVYGMRVANILSLANFGSELYSERLFKVVYRYIKPAVKVPKFYDPIFDMYRGWGRLRCIKLGDLARRWLRRRRFRQQIFGLQSGFLKKFDFYKYLYNLVSDRLRFKERYYNMLRQVWHLPFLRRYLREFKVSRFFSVKGLDLQIVWSLLILYQQIRELGVSWFKRPLLVGVSRLKRLGLCRVFKKFSWRGDRLVYRLLNEKSQFSSLISMNRYRLFRLSLDRNYDSGLGFGGRIEDWKWRRRFLRHKSSGSIRFGMLSSDKFKEKMFGRFGGDKFKTKMSGKLSDNKFMRKMIGKEFIKRKKGRGRNFTGNVKRFDVKNYNRIGSRWK